MSLIQQTLTKLRALNLSGMAEAYDSQLQQPKLHDFPFEDRLGMLVDSEFTTRETRRLKRLIKSAGFAEAPVLEDLDTRPSRGLDKTKIATLAGATG